MSLSPQLSRVVGQRIAGPLSPEICGRQPKPPANLVSDEVNHSVYPAALSFKPRITSTSFFVFSKSKTC
ncbi:hypothetical protein SAMN05216459_104147 [Ensifer sp. OV372]|nr:hypothetical protein SAMN05216459_104147 [Ensifer sp. OV372]